MKSRPGVLKLLVAAVMLPATAGTCLRAEPATSAASMESEFQSPPASAKPRVWWHWMSGNVTQEGITADLEWMHRVGIGGMQAFDIDLGVAHYMKPVVFMSPEWQAAMKHAAMEADRLHLEMAMAASGGWSETAGPWVKPAEAMKKAVWSGTKVTGPGIFTGKLPSPPQRNGPFQGLGITERPITPIIGGAPATYVVPAHVAPEDIPFYADSVVLAYRLPRAEVSMTALHPKITSSDGHFDATALSDGDYGTVAELHSDATGGIAWVQWEFSQSFTVRAFTLGMGAPPLRITQALPDGRVESSDDGVHWRQIVSLPDSPQWGRPFAVRTFAFAPVAARFFRLTLQQPVLSPDKIKRGITVPKVFLLAEAELFATPRINFFEDKASFGTYLATKDTPTPPVANEDAIAPTEVIDLTAKLRPDGSLDWQIPAGNWVILRLGYSLTGKKNYPATSEAMGYEVDKLSHEHVANYLDQYTGMIRNAVGANYGRSFQYLLMDSWEAGEENWTESILTEFHRRRGYDPLPYLPTLTGRVVQSAATSDAFLWDFRLTISELLAENHYKLATDTLTKQGLGLYAEAMGISMPTTGDGLLNKGQVTIPMGEFWTPPPDTPDNPVQEADIREASSAAHIYGKRIVAAESFTSLPTTVAWAQSPFYLKQLADRNFARGVNRIVFHTSDHQPFVDHQHEPGITLGYFGQHYSRNITWAEQAVAWNSYLARCSYLLQQGRPVVDVAYFYGEGAPVTVPYWKQFSPAVPAAFSCDYLNSDVLLHRSSVEGGKLTLKGGMSYRILVIPDELTALSPPLLRKLGELVSAGAIVVAPRAVGSPSLSETQTPEELRRSVEALWGATAPTSGSHRYGKGKVYWGSSLETVFAAEDVKPDFTSDLPQVISTYDYPVPQAAADLVWTHRQTPTADLYFVANQKVRTEEVVTTYRQTGRAVELWHPDTGKTEPVAYRIENGRTQVTLHLAPEESVFVVFRGEAAATPRSLPASQTEIVAKLDGPWKLTFPAGRGAPAQIDIPILASWTESSNPGVKYFSGTATYSQDFAMDEAALKSGAVFQLELGRVKEIAEVSVNGHPVGSILWKPPFAADISPVLKSGLNHIEVRVTNLWPNRLIGDQQPGNTEQPAFVDFKAYTATDPLIESGLLGPVRIIRQRFEDELK